MINGKFFATDDFDLAGHRFLNWRWLEDLPTEGASENDVIKIIDGVPAWAPGGSGGSGGPVDWDDILNKPTEFPPEDHTHPWSALTGTLPDYIVPTGGITGQRLAKASSANYDMEWVDDCPPYKYIKATGQSEGDLHLSDGTNWATSKALIKQIVISTTSTDWELWILQNDNGYSTDDATIPAVKLADNMSGDATFRIDHAYNDEDASNEVHLYWQDNAGTATYDVIIAGYALS